MPQVVFFSSENILWKMILIIFKFMLAVFLRVEDNHSGLVWLYAYDGGGDVPPHLLYDGFLPLHATSLHRYTPAKMCSRHSFRCDPFRL